MCVCVCVLVFSRSVNTQHYCNATGVPLRVVVVTIICSNIRFCSQLLGFDIIVLDNLRIKLLEVNANPSLRIDYQKELAPHICEYFPSVVDINIKKPLLLDILKVIRPTLASRRMKCKQRTSIQSDKSKQSISASNTDG